MSEETCYIGQRLSLKQHACTIRYLGPVQGKPGQWLGVEWDDTYRGKHNGSHEDVRYFECRSKSATAASFLRPKQDWDRTRTFLEALSDKYFRPEDARADEIIYVSKSKQFEEVGFEKFAQRQAELRGIHVLVLDRMQIRHIDRNEDAAKISSICADIIELDLSCNLFEELAEILELVSHLPRLRRLVLDDNRFSINFNGSRPRLVSVAALSISNMQITAEELSQCLTYFPNVTALFAAANDLTSVPTLPASVESVDLSGNVFTNLDQLNALTTSSRLKSLILKHNKIAQSTSDPYGGGVILSASIEELDLSYNLISAWHIFDDLNTVLPALLHLRVTGNPLYSGLLSVEQKPLAAADGYMLTIARLPKLTMFNYSAITEQSRLNAEKFYLEQIIVQLSQASETAEAVILAGHPRWRALCEEYGTPAISRMSTDREIDPDSLEARLVKISFKLADGTLPQASTRSWGDTIPRTYNVYALYASVHRHLRQVPFTLRLVWETEEQDPIAGMQKDDVELWDSSDEEVDSGVVWMKREVQLVPSTRPLGTYLEGRSAVIRVEAGVFL